VKLRLIEETFSMAQAVISIISVIGGEVLVQSVKLESIRYNPVVLVGAALSAAP
jgi:hypothetical protein